MARESDTPARSNRVVLEVLLACLLLGLECYYLIAAARFVDLEGTQKRDTEALGPFDSGHAYVQEFVAGRSSLSQIDLLFASAGYRQAAAFRLTVGLDDASGAQIAERRYFIPKHAGEFHVSLRFPAQEDSAGRLYRLALATDAPPQVVSLNGSDYDAHPEWILWRNGQPLRMDLGFRAYSKPGPWKLIGQTLDGSGGRLAVLLFIGLIFWSVGAAIVLHILPPRNLIELITFPLLTSLALVPFLLFLLSLGGIRLTRDHLIAALAVIALASIAWLVFSGRNARHRALHFSWQIRETIPLLILLLFALFSRLAQINDLLVPGGIAGLAHQRILQRIESKETIPLDSIYPMGFHSNVFLVHELAGTAPPEAVLLVGQGLGILSGLSLYVLARRLLKQPWYALTAASVYWFLAPVPSLLVNWGRYPFLQGLALLPCALVLLPGLRRGARGHRLAAGILGLGLFFSHYGLFLIFAVLAGVILLRRAPLARLDVLPAKGVLVALAVVALPAALVLIGKSYVVLSEGTWSYFYRQDPLAYTSWDYQHFLGHTLKNGGVIVWLLGAAGYILLALRDRRVFILSVLTGAGLLLVDGLQMEFFHHSASRPVNLLYFLFIPLSLLAAFLFKVLFQRSRWVTYAFAAAAVLAGSYNISGIADPVNVFYTAADRDAMDWIQMHTPHGSLFLINSYPYEGEYQPEDGGGWIPYMTGRKVTFLSSAQQYQQAGEAIARSGAAYIYIGSGYGALGFSVVGDPDYELLYAQQGRFIYKVEGK